MVSFRPLGGAIAGLLGMVEALRIHETPAIAELTPSRRRRRVSKYVPHQGTQEKARRVRQMKRGII